MLLDFPKVRKFADEILMRWFHKRVFQKTGIMQDLRMEAMQEGDRIELHRYNGSIQHVDMKPTGSQLKLEQQAFKKQGLGAVIEAMDQTAADMAAKQTKYFFRQLDQICEESGQTYDAKGEAFSFELILKQLETIDIDFDENGQPLMPTIVSGPDIAEKIKKLEVTDKQCERFEEIIEGKFIEWRERESCRRLVS